MARGKKLSDKDFWSILRKNRGLYARTARYIEKEFGVSYTRQAVRERAMMKPELYAEIVEESIDLAEEGLHDLMTSSLPNIKLNAIKLFLQSRGADRGYAEKSNVNHDGKIVIEFIDP